MSTGKLTDAKVRTAKPGEKPIKLTDGAGMYLEVAPSGGKWWRLKYRVDGVERRISLGTYPDTSLVHARQKRDAARTQLAHGIDPGAFRKAQKAARVERGANSFETIAREWHTARAVIWAPGHAERVLRRLERDVFPKIGGRPIAELKAPEILEVLRKIEARNIPETAHRTLTNVSQVMRYGVATGRIESDPTRDLRGALKPVQERHFAAITDPPKLGELLRGIENYRGSPIVRCALRLAPHVFVRPGELRNARWADVDWEAAEWRFTLSKTATQHVVPLSTQAVAILREVEAVSGGGTYVFPGARSMRLPMSENAVLYALRGLGFDGDTMTGHGFRAAARTILDEVLGWRVDLVEHQLGHAVKDANGRAYNRTSHLPERRKMMQAWSDFLDVLRTGSNVTAIGAAKASA
jgi:integrase